MRALRDSLRLVWNMETCNCKQNMAFRACVRFCTYGALVESGSPYSAIGVAELPSSQRVTLFPSIGLYQSGLCKGFAL